SQTGTLFGFFQRLFVASRVPAIPQATYRARRAGSRGKTWGGRPPLQHVMRPSFPVAEQQRGAVRARTGCPRGHGTAQLFPDVPGPPTRSGTHDGSDSSRKVERVFPLVPDVPYVFRGAQPSGAAAFDAKHAIAAQIATRGWQFEAKVPLPVPLGAEKPTKGHERLRDIVHFRFAV